LTESGTMSFVISYATPLLFLLQLQHRTSTSLYGQLPSFSGEGIVTSSL
jgi:hypothetical protein